MTALERKAISEQILISIGIPPLQDSLPPMEEDGQVNIRSATEIGQRLLVLSYLNYFAWQPDWREQIMTEIVDEGLWKFASPREKSIFNEGAPGEEDLDYILWRNESIWVLLWALGSAGTLDLPNRHVDVEKMIELIPPLFEDSNTFLSSAEVRSHDDIMQQADLHFRLCWSVRESDGNGLPPPPIEPGVAFERHFAFEWIKGVRAEWDAHA